MNWKKEWKALAAFVVVFGVLFLAPLSSDRVSGAILEAIYLAQWYAQEHVILCLIPAFFIAGAIAVFVSQASVIKYLGAGANKVVAYGVASVSGSVLAVCSCTILPLFAGIYRMGAGLGPASAFLYAGPAINVLAIILTARVLGFELGVARAVGAVLFSIVIGLLMHLIFLREEREKSLAQAVLPPAEVSRPLWQNILYFASMIAILVFANWSGAETTGVWGTVLSLKWYLSGASAILLAVMLIRWFAVVWWHLAIVTAATGACALALPEQPLVAFSVGALGVSIVTARHPGEAGQWFEQTWGYARQMLPLLLFGVLAAGLLLGRPGHEGVIPSHWISSAVGGNGLGANLFASIAGAFMYFATLTEIPILQGLIGSGMGKGPALALLLAGPALSLPSMLVLRSILGLKKTAVFVLLVILMATVSGLVYGEFF